MIETKTVVQGGHGPVPMEENSRRYIDADPVTVPMTAYYLRRMLSGELIDAPAAPVVQETPAGASGGGGGVVVTAAQTPIAPTTPAPAAPDTDNSEEK